MARLMAVGMVPYLGSSREESETSKVGFCPENMPILARGTKRTTGLIVGYIKVSRLLNGEDLVA